MSIVFYYAPQSSASPVAAALAELEVPHDAVRLDLATGAQRQPAFLRVNPNGKVPALVVDGTPMFEALAILLWLGDRYGVDKGLWPAADASARRVAYSWSAWAYVSYGQPLQRLWLATSDRVDQARHDPAQAQACRGELDRLLGILDQHLADRPHMLGEAYSLTDLIVASVIGYGTFVGASVQSHRHVQRWLEQCEARPAMRAGT